MSKNWEHAAGVLWSDLAKAAKKRRVLTYSDVAPIINTNPLSVRLALEPIQSYCMDNNLPPLSSIVVGKNSRVPGGGFIACDVKDIENAQAEVFDHHWGANENPFFGYSKNDTTNSFAIDVLRNPERAREIYAKVKVRGPLQRIFRESLIKAYCGKCAICGLSFIEALEAAHIVPWALASNSERISPFNGILLCSNHHKMYDKDRIQITEQLKVQITESETDYGSVDSETTLKFDGEPLRLPKEIGLRPSVEMIRKRLKINAA